MHAVRTVVGMRSSNWVKRGIGTSRIDEVQTYLSVVVNVLLDCSFLMREKGARSDQKRRSAVMQNVFNGWRNEI